LPGGVLAGSVGGGCVGTSDGDSTGADGEGVGHVTVITPPPGADGSGVGSRIDGTTPPASGVGPGMQVVVGDGAAHP
jgi:hypothetical protein